MIDVDALLDAPTKHTWSTGALAGRGAARGASDTAVRAIAERMPPSIEHHGGDQALLKCASDMATVTASELEIYEALAEVFNPRCLPPWPDKKIRLEAKRAAKRAADPAVAYARRARARHEGAPRETHDAHTHDPSGAAPLILRSRDGHNTLLRESDERGLQPIAKDVIKARIRELGLDALIPLWEGNKPRSATAILDDAATYVVTAYTFGSSRAEYDPSGEGRVTIGTRITDPPAPREDARAARWLRALGGPHVERLETWIASCSQANIDRLAACLILIGRSDAGKSLFGHAIARLWGRGISPPPMSLIVTRFNGGMLRCPLLADEEAQLFGSRALSTKRFRDAIQSTTRGVELKNREVVELVGAQRFIVGCNALSDIQFADLGGAGVIEAVQDRLLVIDCTARSEECRRALDPLRLPDDHRVDLEAIAGHFAWLAERVVLPVERFAGSGHAASAETLLAGHVLANEELFETLRAVLDGHVGEGPWYERDARLYVDRPALAVALEARGRGWDLPRVSRALDPFRVAEARIRVGAKGRRVRVWELDAERLGRALSD